MYSYTYIAHNRQNDNISTPNYTALSDVLIESITPSEVTLSVTGLPITATFTGSFDYEGTPVTGAEVAGTLTSKTVYLNGALLFVETWADGSDWLLGDTDFAYELSKLSGNDYFEGSPTTVRNDRVQGLGGNDRFKGFGSTDENSTDRFYGGDGVDTSVYQGKISEYSINSSKGTDQSPHIWDSRVNTANTLIEDGVRTPGFYVRDTVSNRDDLDSLAEVERLEFEVAEANGANRVALDIVGNGGTAAKALGFDSHGNGGKAAKIVGALWGKESVENPTFVGIVLHYLDLGVSYEALLGLGLNALLGANKTNEAVASLLYTNLMGEAPTQDAKKELSGYMDSGAYSQAGFARAIADLELNATNINLVGLSDTGLQYTEYVA
ncbi:hypothetical protein N9K17_05065 [Burkholderiaceae bacterium]|nr:hypothetical protein [Burkholderiaceae bacterium]